MSATAFDAAAQTAVARPLRVLVPLIKQDLERGNEAGIPYYRAAGEKMLKAKCQIDHGEFGAWIKRNFGVGKSQSNYYMSLARATADWQKSAEEDFSSLKDFRRRGLGETNGHEHEDINERETDRIREESLSLHQERDADRKLALRIIKIGYKVLAKELHPDKGGAQADMARLTRVRDKLVHGGTAGSDFARTGELVSENARLRRENLALRSEVDELKAAAASTNPDRWSNT